MNGPDGGDSLNDHNGLLSPGSQLDLVLSEVRRLEEMSNRFVKLPTFYMSEFLCILNSVTLKGA